MKFGVICLFFILCLAAEFSSALWSRRNNYRVRRNFNYRVGRNTNLNKNGLNHRSNNGRHNTNLNYRQFRYNYRGNRWNTNFNHNFRSRQTNLNANYRGNHNFRVGHNWRNRHTNFGYRWNFGKRRRSTDIQDEVLEILKIEREPKVFQEKLQLAVNEFIKRYQNIVPQSTLLSISVPKGEITNTTVAQEIVCVVKKLQKILPKSLGNFITKMINYHGRSFDIKDLRDFFSVGPKAEQQDACEVPDVPASSEVDYPPTLMEMKKFVTALITVAMEYQQMLEN